MSEKNSLVEEAIIQMKNLEDVIAENAKGILASTMKGEISELVKESLKEQDEDDTEVTVDNLETGDEEEIDVDTDVDADDDFDTDVENDGLVDLDDTSNIEFDDEEVVDMRGASASELQKVFKKMKPEDGIIVTQDNGSITLSDENSDNEYLIKLGESKNKKKSNLNEMKKSGHGEEFSSQDEMFEMDDMDNMDFYGEESESLNEISDEDLDELIASLGAESSDEYEMSFDNDEYDSLNIPDDMPSYKTKWNMPSDNEDEEFDEFGESDEMSMDDLGETIYEITLDEETDEEMDEEWSEEMDEEWSEEMDEEDYNEEEMTNESIGFKAVGKGFGKPKFDYKKTTGGFKEDKKQGPRGVGMGKGPKFEFNEGETETAPAKPKVKPGTETEKKPGNPMRNPNKENEPAPAKAKAKKSETKEAARTLGNGKKWGRNGLNKPIAAPRHLAVESVNAEVDMLKSKNEEYRKALNVFRDKLNEVAVFNSNLAYATRLFTEHSTTKQEKINILRRFDGAETIKESKTLYKVIKDELSNKNESQVVKESVEVKINRTPSTGAVNLIESKTYENPQFMRMKDIMNKLIK
jgi:hypothetical protein